MSLNVPSVVFFSGIRHFAVLKLIGTEGKASGTVELFPLNGTSWQCGAFQMYGTVMEHTSLKSLVIMYILR